MDTWSCIDLQEEVSPHPCYVPTVLLAGWAHCRAALLFLEGSGKKCSMPAPASCRYANIPSDGPRDVTRPRGRGGTRTRPLPEQQHRLLDTGELTALPCPQRHILIAAASHHSHRDVTQPFGLQPNPRLMSFTPLVGLHTRILVPMTLTGITAIIVSPVTHTADPRGPKNKGQVTAEVFTVKWGLVGWRVRKEAHSQGSSVEKLQVSELIS